MVRAGALTFVPSDTNPSSFPKDPIPIINFGDPKIDFMTDSQSLQSREPPSSQDSLDKFINEAADSVAQGDKETYNDTLSRCPCCSQVCKVMAMITHLNDHLKKQDTIPKQWLDANGRGFCTVCNLILSTKAKANFWSHHQIFCHESCRKFYKPPNTLVYRVKGAATTTTPVALASKPSKPPALNPSAAQAPKPVHPPVSAAPSASFGPQASRNLPPAVPAPTPPKNAQPRISGVFHKQKSAEFVEQSTPSFEAIFQSQVFVKNFIPISCVKLVAKAFNFAVDQVMLKNDVPSWKQFFAMSRCILSVVPKKSSKTVVMKDIITKRVDLFLQGKWVQLFADAKQDMLKLKMDHGSSSEQSNLEKLVISKTEQGNISSAYKLLDSNGIHDIHDPAILQKLHELHPSEPHCSYKFRDQGASNSSKMVFDYADVEKCVFSFPKGTSAGPDGLSAQHLKDLLKFNPIGSSFDVRTSLKKFLEFIVDGKAVAEVSKYFACSRLIPLKKKDNGVRPIAIGLTIRRLASKLLLRKLNDKLKLENQFGICCPNGMDTIIHATRIATKLFSADPDFAIFQI